VGVDRRDQRAARPPGTEPDPSALRYAQPMEAVADELPGGRVVWAFAPADRVERVEQLERVEPVDQP
jgi:hypothetical protein